MAKKKKNIVSFIANEKYILIQPMNYMWVLHHRQFIQEGKKSQERKYT